MKNISKKKINKTDRNKKICLAHSNDLSNIFYKCICTEKIIKDLKK